MDEETLRELGRDAYRKGDFDLATSYYRQVLEIQPYNYEVMVKLGSVLFLQSNFKAAAQVYSDAIAKLENQGEKGEALGNMHISLAEACLKLHRFEEAQAQLDIADKTGANPALLCDGWGSFYYAIGAYDKALAVYQEYTRLVPDDQDGYLGIAKAYQNLKQYDSASASLKTAKSLGPDDYWVEIALGNLAMTLKDYSSALNHYISAKELDPRKPAVIVGMGQAYLMMQDYDNAKKMFFMALERRPNDTNSMCDLAQVELITGNARQAVALLKSAIVIDPSNHSHYMMLLQAQATSGKLLDAFRTALEARKLSAHQKA